jgi:hypothetical protein
MHLKETLRVRTGSNHFNTVEELLQFREQLRESHGITNLPVTRETLMQDGLILSENHTLDEDGFGYTRTRIWRSRVDYGHDYNFNVVYDINWQTISTTLEDIEE